MERLGDETPFVLRPGSKYNCYLPRLQGVEAIPTLTPTRFRDSCSANCSHSWKPKPPPPVPTPPPPDPATIYQLKYLKDQTRTWENEINQIEELLEELKNTDVESENWIKARTQQERIKQMDRSAQRMTQEYKNELFKNFEISTKSRQTREEAKNSKIDELKRLRKHNDDLAEYVQKLESYENIGSVRDDLSYRKLKTESERHKEKVQYEIENPPFLTPTIEIPKLPDIPSPRENQELAIEITKIKKMNESEKILISQMKKEISETKKQILIKREVLGLPEKISLDPIRSIELDHMHEVPTLSIPIQNDIHFTID